MAVYPKNGHWTPYFGEPSIELRRSSVMECRGPLGANKGQVILVFPTDGSTAEKCASIALGLLRRGRLLCWFAENAATTFDQTSRLLANAASNTLNIRSSCRRKSKKC